MTLGERNNNPLNIRKVPGTHWRGEVSSPLGEVGRGAGGSFVRFVSLEWGLRAAFCLLRTYRDKHKLVCIKDIISRWAPPSENDTRAYIRDVCLLTGFGGLQRLTEKEWPALVGAMARIECGMKLSPTQLEKGFELYREK